MSAEESFTRKPMQQRPQRKQGIWVALLPNENSRPSMVLILVGMHNNSRPIKRACLAFRQKRTGLDDHDLTAFRCQYDTTSVRDAAADRQWYGALGCRAAPIGLHFTVFVSTISITMVTLPEEEGNRDLRELRKTVASFCEQAGYRLSPHADEILGDMVHMKETAGDFYCPCQTQRVPETVCVCQPVRQGLVDVMGACFCGLILTGE